MLTPQVSIHTSFRNEFAYSHLQKKHTLSNNVNPEKSCILLRLNERKLVATYTDTPLSKQQDMVGF